MHKRKDDPVYRKIREGEARRKNDSQIYRDDLFDNPMIKAAKETIPQEQQDKWASAGESMYGAVDFVDGNGKTQTVPEDMMEGLAYVTDSIKSGMHISMLEKNERDLLKEFYGETWYKKFGYTEKDLFGIHTIPDYDILNSK